MYLRQVGVVPTLSCMENIELWCVGTARGFCFGQPLPRFAVVIFTAIPPPGYPGCRCYVSATVEGCDCYGWDGWSTVC